MLLGRHPRSHLDLAKPDLHQQIESQQSMQAAKAGGRKEKTLGISTAVFVKNFCNGQRWLPGTITQSSGPKSFMIELTDGRIMRRHVNHIRHRSSTLTPMIEADIDDWTTTIPLFPEVPSVGPLLLLHQRYNPYDVLHVRDDPHLISSRRIHLKGEEVW